MSKNKSKILIYIVVAQFAATTLWFSGNAIYPSVQADLGLEFDITPSLTIAVQLGFILGTLIYALGMIPDRYSPSKVFFLSCVMAAIANLSMLFLADFSGLFITRLSVGFFLAGVYPVGMKIVTDWFPVKSGTSLAFLVGALVLGTSLPHFVKNQSIGLDWSWVLVVTSVLASLAGIVIFFLVGDGPHRKKGKAFSLHGFMSLFQSKMTNRASLGYFGHMWELYTFWAFVPVMITLFNRQNNLTLDVSLWSFIIIGMGSLGCIFGGLISRRFGSCRIAFFSMLTSASCALFSLVFFSLSTELFLIMLMIWGFFVVMDSPQFTSVIADYSDKKYLGSTLTIVNCIGFAITIVSLRLMDYLVTQQLNFFWLLAIGPVLGLYPTGKVAFRPSFPKL